MGYNKGTRLLKSLFYSKKHAFHITIVSPIYPLYNNKTCQIVFRFDTFYYISDVCSVNDFEASVLTQAFGDNYTLGSLVVLK